MFKHLVNRKKIEWIAYNYKMTSHAQERIKERYVSPKTIRQAMLDSCLAWFQEEDLVAIAINNDDIFYVRLSYDHMGNMEYATLVTYTWKSKNGYTVVDKFCKNYLEKKKKMNIKALEDE